MIWPWFVNAAIALVALIAALVGHKHDNEYLLNIGYKLAAFSASVYVILLIWEFLL